MKFFFIILLIFVLSPYASAENVFDSTATELIADIDGDGKEETVTLTKTQVKNEEGILIAQEWYINIVSKGKLYKSEEIVVESTRPAYLKEIATPENFSFIGVIYTAGAHSGNLDLYRFYGDYIAYSQNILSGQHLVEIKDADNDGENEIISHSRDYDNAFEDEFILTHKYKDKGYHVFSIFSTATGEYLDLEKLKSARPRKMQDE